MRYSFRVWLLNLGLIGDEYKNCRTHLLKHLTGDIAWRHPEDGVAQRERLRQERIATRSQVERASVDMPNDGMPAREQEQRNEPPCDERVATVCDDRQEVGETPNENLEVAVSDCDDFEETEDEGMAMSM